jgi:hypothetical protein
MRITLLLVALALAGCGSANRSIAGLSGYANVCVDGVAYLQFPSGVTPKYRPDGSLETCK